MEHCHDLDIPSKLIEKSNDPKTFELILSGRQIEISVKDVLQNQPFEDDEGDNIIFTESNSSMLYPSLEKSNII